MMRKNLHKKKLNYNYYDREIVLKKLLLVTLFMLAVGVGIGCVQKPEKNITNEDDKEYLIFCVQNMPMADTRDAVIQLRDFYGPNDPESKRLIGFSRMSIMLFKQSIQEKRDIVNMMFDLAEEFDMPAYLHLDMVHNSPTSDQYEGPEKKFYDDPMMCEWVGFPKPGEKHGPAPRFWNNWGCWFSAPAFPCFASESLQEYVREQLQKGVLDPMMDRIEKLKQQNKEYLFAGICIGWETAIYNMKPGDPFVFVKSEDPPVDVCSRPNITMQQWEMGQLGYGSLHHLGYDQQRLEKEAKEKNITTKALFIEICHKVGHDYTEMLAKEVFDRGIKPRKIFSHTVAIDTVDSTPSTSRPPVWAAVNPYCTPGFTMDNFGEAVYDLKKVKQQIHKADPRQKNLAVAETYFRSGTTEGDYTKFFNDMFDNGATLIHILAWHSGRANPDSPFHVPPVMEGPNLSVTKWRAAGKR